MLPHVHDHSKSHIISGSGSNLYLYIPIINLHTHLNFKFKKYWFGPAMIRSQTFISRGKKRPDSHYEINTIIVT